MYSETMKRLAEKEAKHVLRVVDFFTLNYCFIYLFEREDKLSIVRISVYCKQNI